jgi:hypothetical protein
MPFRPPTWIIDRGGAAFPLVVTGGCDGCGTAPALVDLALDIEFDAPSLDLILDDRPWTLRLLHALRSLAADVRDVLAPPTIALGLRPWDRDFRPLPNKGLR